jgi:hypothetical protein
MNGFELYTEIQKIDNQVKICFITAGEMYYEKVRKGQLEEDEEEEEQYCALNTEPKANFKRRSNRKNKQNNDAKLKSKYSKYIKYIIN